MLRMIGAGALLMLFSVAATVQAADVYRFTYRGLEVGEVAVQRATFDMQIVMSIEQANQTIDATRHKVLRTQTCRLTVLATDTIDGAPVKTKVRLTYEAADQSAQQNDDPAQEAALPVAGKTYFASRGDDDKLIITDERGQRPSDEEWAIVATATDMLGKPNPIAKFFHGRTIEVGQELRMPPQLAKELLGYSGRIDNASKFILNCKSVEAVRGVPCAVFDAQLESKMTQGTTMSMQMKGELVLEIDTCRSVYIDLAGPMSLAEAHGPADGQFVINTRGNVRMALQAEYPRAVADSRGRPTPGTRR